MEQTLVAENAAVEKLSYPDQVEAQQIIEAQKDRSMFAPLYKKYHEKIFKYIQSRVGEMDTSADITSQVFLKAMTKLDTFVFKGLPFSSWLFRIAHNEMIDFFRDQSKSRERIIDANTEGIKEIAIETEVGYSQEVVDKLFSVLEGLSEKDLMLIEMRYFEKRSFKEVADILEITENNAKVKLYRLLDQMKRRLN